MRALHLNEWTTIKIIIIIINYISLKFCAIDILSSYNLKNFKCTNIFQFAWGFYVHGTLLHADTTSFYGLFFMAPYLYLFTLGLSFVIDRRFHEVHEQPTSNEDVKRKVWLWKNSPINLPPLLPYQKGSITIYTFRLTSQINHLMTMFFNFRILVSPSFGSTPWCSSRFYIW